MAVAPLLVITGPPGSGKSTTARLLAERLEPATPEGPVVLVEGDRFFGFVAAGLIEPWRPASAAQNAVIVDASAAATGRFVGAGWTTIFDGVIGPWFIDRFLAGLGVTETDYAILLPSVERCIERVTERTGHEFGDLPATRKMHHEFDRSEFEHRHRFENGDESPEQTVGRILAARHRGELRYRS